MNDKKIKRLLLDLARVGAPNPGSEDFCSWLASPAGKPFRSRVKQFQDQIKCTKCGLHGGLMVHDDKDDLLKHFACCDMPPDEAEGMAAQFALPIYKQGDDLGQHLSEEPTVKVALLAYARRLHSAAAMVEELARYAGSITVEQADTHYISVAGPTPVIRLLIDEGVLCADEEGGVDQ